jgi:hypothetical protein
MASKAHANETARKARRLKTFLPVTVQRVGTTSRIHILDLSESGARAAADFTPLPGEPMDILWDEATITGRVVWIRSDRFGLRFDQPIPAPLLDKIVAAH